MSNSNNQSTPLEHFSSANPNLTDVNMTNTIYLHDSETSNERIRLLFVTIIPILIIMHCMIIIGVIVHKIETNPSIMNKIRVMTYLIAQFVFLPFLVIYLIVNGILLLISYFWLDSLIYFSTKSFIPCSEKYYKKCRCCYKKTEVNMIKIVSKMKDDSLPERANRYKDNEENQVQLQGMNLNKNNPSKLNENSLSINNNNNQGKNKNIFEVNNNYRPSIKKSPDKGKIVEFLANALINEDGTPGYISLMKRVKDEAKQKKEKKSRFYGISAVNTLSKF